LIIFYLSHSVRDNIYMRKLQEVLQNFFGTNASFFDFFQKKYSDGYWFWELGVNEKLLTDIKFANNFDIEAGELELEKINREDLKSSITKIINTIEKSDLSIQNKNTFELQFYDHVFPVDIFYLKLKNKKTDKEFIFAALQFIDNDKELSGSAVDMFDIAVWKWNIQTNELIINGKYAKMLGYSIQELSPLNHTKFKTLFHNEDLKAIEKRIAEYSAGKREEYVGEHRLKHKNGHLIWASSKEKILSRTSDGKAEWIIGSHFDITVKKSHELEKEALELIPLKSKVPVIITNAKGKITFINEAFEKQTGFNLHEVTGKKPGDFLQGPGTSIEHVKAVSSKLRAGKPFSQEILNYSKTGEKYWVLLSVDPIYDQNGKIEKFIAIQKNISEQKKHEEYLAKFKSTLDQTEDCVFTFDKDSLQFTYVNKGAELLMGYTEKELLQLHPYDIKPEYPIDKFIKLVETLKIGKDKSIRFETIHRSKSGKEIPVEVFLQYIAENVSQPYFVAIVHDITMKKQLEKEMQRLSLVVEKTQNLVVITDKSGCIEYVNPAFEQKTGYSLKEVIGKKPGYFLHGPETNPVHVQSNRENLKKLKPFTQEILNYTRSGEKYWVSITFNPVFNENNELTKFIAIEQEITTRIEKENLLKESEERLQFVLKGSEIGYWDWEAETGKMTVNNRWYEILGYKPEDFEVSLEKWHSLVHPHDMENLNNIMENVFPHPDQNDFNVEIRAKHKKGHYIWILDRGAVVERTKEGEPIRISGMHMEITQRKKLEEELEGERNFMSKVISANALSLVIINKLGEITFANNGSENILGLSKNNIESKKYNDTDWEHITLEDEPFPKEDLPFAQVLHSKKAIKDIEHGIIWKDGAKKYISVTGTPFTYYGEEVEEVIFSVTDITKRIEAQKQLGRTETQLQSILKDMADVVWSVGFPDYKMIYITPSIEKITGFSQSYYLENYVGNRWEEAVYIRDKHLVDKAYKDLEKDGSFEIEVRIRTKDGQLKWVQNKGAIIYDDEGLPVRLDGYISDISERKAQESDLMKYFEVVEGQNERLKNFTYIVSHNVRSHSANIQGLINLIKQLNPDIYKNEYVQMLDISSLRLDDTLHQLNEVISVVSSVQKLKKLKVYEIVENLKNAFSILLNNSEVNLINEIEEDIFVEATPAYLESILTNLITNAIKYSDPNKGSYVKLRSQNINGSVNIFIEDNGLGLDLEKYGSKLFGMYKTFHQHKDARGIGLFLSKNQAESMGGKIEVESKVGIGSTFKLILKNGDI